MQPNDGTFIIARADQLAAPVVLVQPGILLGRLPSSQIVLNHPTVSRIHAGINRIGNEFFLINLSRQNPVIINGRLLASENADILAPGDLVQLGPYLIEVQQADKQLVLNITQQATTGVTTSGGLADSMIAKGRSRRLPTGSLALMGKGTGRLTAVGVNDVLKVFWQKRTRNRAERLTPLHPRERPLPGKARINWRPTRDLIRDWPPAIFLWSFLAVAVLAVVAGFVYAPSFAPAAISSPHTRTSLTRIEGKAIADRVNGSSCTSCHRPVAKMETACTECHQAKAFHADITAEHRAAGITCTACHSEHKGDDYQPIAAGFASCAKCHTDSNQTVYQGRRVSTPHGGTVGYPVRNGTWTWPGLSEAELSVLPEVMAQKKVQDDLKDWRSKQFHALHVYRIKITAGLAGNPAGQVSCSTCHRSFAPVDRVTPATTCASCHQQFEQQAKFAGDSTPAINCTSCHVQHPLDAARWGAWLTNSALAARTDAIRRQIAADGVK
ncbi:MAG: FHA domain-containing protein [Pyrinomonadaceae bacterium]